MSAVPTSEGTERLDGTVALLKRLQRTARTALEAVHELERIVGTDLIGRYRESVEDFDMKEASRFLSAALAEAVPGQDLEIIVIARQRREDAPDGQDQSRH